MNSQRFKSLNECSYNILKVIQDMVDIIYSVDHDGLVNKFINLTETLRIFISYIDNNHIGMDIKDIQLINYIINNIETSFISKDYVALADSLNYELKPVIKEIIGVS